MEAFAVSAMSLKHRAELSRLFSQIKRVRPRVEFWRIPAHRIPTLWSLYRQLLRDAPSPDIRWRMQMFFRRSRNLTSPMATRMKLQTAHKWLDIFRQARQGDEHLRKVLNRYQRMVIAKREKEQMKTILREEWAWQAKLKNRPILTGSYLRPSIYNKPLPRMHRQPVHVSMMIRNRRLKRAARGEKYTLLNSWRYDIRAEREFEKSLSRVAKEQGVDVEPVFRDSEWEQSIKDQQYSIRETFARDTQRAETPYSAEMLAQIKQARRDKVRNKTRELDRERHGEVLRRTIARRRKGPPAHVLATMTKEQREMDKVVRSVSEIGYVAQMKMKMGMKMRDPEKWKMEIGSDADRERLDRMEKEVRRINEERRRKAEHEGQ